MADKQVRLTVSVILLVTLLAMAARLTSAVHLHKDFYEQTLRGNRHFYVVGRSKMIPDRSRIISIIKLSSENFYVVITSHTEKECTMVKDIYRLNNDEHRLEQESGTPGMPTKFFMLIGGNFDEGFVVKAGEMMDGDILPDEGFYAVLHPNPFAREVDLEKAEKLSGTALEKTSYEPTDGPNCKQQMGSVCYVDKVNPKDRPDMTNLQEFLGKHSVFYTKVRSHVSPFFARFFLNGETVTIKRLKPRESKGKYYVKVVFHGLFGCIVNSGVYTLNPLANRLEGPELKESDLTSQKFIYLLGGTAEGAVLYGQHLINGVDIPSLSFFAALTDNVDKHVDLSVAKEVIDQMCGYDVDLKHMSHELVWNRHNPTKCL